MSIHQLLTSHVASITQLKKDPMGTMKAGTAYNGAVAILNHNEPVFYCITPELFAYFKKLQTTENNTEPY